jgi:uncharacterized lipoprotein YmbA
MSPRAFAIVALCVGGLGCSFMKPSTDPTTFYVLTSTTASPAAVTSERMQVIGLGPIHLPEYLDRPQLVTRVAANQLRISDVERWAEPLGDALASRLKDDLAPLLSNDQISLYPWDPTLHPDADVAIDVLRFERISDQSVELGARWTIRDATGRVRNAKESHLREPAAGADAQSAVAALSRAVAALGREIAEAIQDSGI